jgi:hypothetical protein
METLNYQSPRPPKLSTWQHGYLISVLLVTLLHFTGSLCLMGYIDPNPADVGPNSAYGHPWPREFARVYEFPMLTMVDVGNGVNGAPIMSQSVFAMLATMNASLWGLCIVGLWREISLLIGRIRRVQRA